jgi:hypothetical protein
MEESMKSTANHSSRVQPATIALASFAYFVLAVVSLYFLNPAYDLLKSFAGNYDLGSYEFLIASTFFSLGVGSLVLAIGLYRGMAPSVCPWTGLLLLGIWAVGMLAAGIFPANEAGGTLPQLTTVLIAGIFPVVTEAVPDTIYGYIHIFALVGSLFSLSPAAILLAPRFKQDEEWRPIYRLALILALLMIAASILFITVLFAPDLLGHSGFIGPVTFIVIGIVTGQLWLFLVAARLRFIVTSLRSSHNKL